MRIKLYQSGIKIAEFDYDKYFVYPVSNGTSQICSRKDMSPNGVFGFASTNTTIVIE